MSIPAQTLPNLEIDVETPWPLKRDGKQVYAKLIDFGGMPLQLRATTHGVLDIEWSQISWDHSYVASSTDGRRRSLALVSTPDTSPSSMPWRFLVDSTSVQVNMQILKDYREWDTVVLCLLYTKTGDGAESGNLIVPGPDGMVLTSRDNELVWEEAGSGCECEIAAPDKNGLVPEGGLPGQSYRVSADGASYEWTDDEVVAVDTNLTLYVRLDGDDANSGLEDTPEGACRTLRGAFDKMMFKYRAVKDGLVTIIRLSPGVHEGGIYLHRNLTSSGFAGAQILGAGSSQSTIAATSDYCVHTRGAQLHLDGLTLACNGGAANLLSQNASYVTFGVDMKLTGTTQHACINMQTGSYFVANGSGALDINVDSDWCIFAVSGGSVLSIYKDTVRMNGSCVHNAISDHAEINFQPANVSGNMTGRRYQAKRLGVISTGGRGENYIPGSLPGAVATGGMYL